jgi:predicted regulator of Ras-like GTPase activity (Roadblock/LC7/MglB family)
MTLSKELAVETLKTVLDSLAALPGVAVVALLDRDGFRIESAGDLDRGSDVTAAWMACLAESCDRIGRELGKGRLRSMVVEYEIGLVFVQELDAAVMLTVLLRGSAELDQLRARAHDAVPDLLAAL